MNIALHQRCSPGPTATEDQAGWLIVHLNHPRARWKTAGKSLRPHGFPGNGRIIDSAFPQGKFPGGRTLSG
jgi:hypothetical protein